MHLLIKFHGLSVVSYLLTRGHASFLTFFYFRMNIANTRTPGYASNSNLREIMAHSLLYKKPVYKKKDLATILRDFTAEKTNI